MRCIHLHGFNCNGNSNNFKFEIGENKIINYMKKSITPIYILDVYRNPIERSMSSFFQNIGLFLPNYKTLTIEELIVFFNSNNLYKETYHPINKMLDAHNLKHFEQFDFQKGYNIVEKGNLIFIKLLFKNIDNWDKILSEIFQKPIKLINDNLTIEKNIFSLYNEFKSQYKIPKHFIEFIKNDKEFKIYNTKIEQKLYIEKWLKTSF
jgi:hypothetical protein